MFIVLKKCLIGASLVALAFSFEVGSANAATCQQLPSCESLGYTDTSCSTGVDSLKCPFDTTKLKCISTQSNDCSDFTLSSCPTSAYCKTCTSGSTTKSKVTHCKVGYEPSHVAAGITCKESSCEGYPLSACPTGAQCGACKSGTNTKYQLRYCEDGYVGTPYACIEGSYKVGDPYYYRGERVGTVFAVPGQPLMQGSSYINQYLMVVGDVIGNTTLTSNTKYEVYHECIELLPLNNISYSPTNDFLYNGLIDQYAISCNSSSHGANSNLTNLLSNFLNSSPSYDWVLPTAAQAFLLARSGILPPDTEFWTTEGWFDDNLSGYPNCHAGAPDQCANWGVLVGNVASTPDASGLEQITVSPSEFSSKKRKVYPIMVLQW